MARGSRGSGDYRGNSIINTRRINTAVVIERALSRSLRSLWLSYAVVLFLSCCSSCARVGVGSESSITGSGDNNSLARVLCSNGDRSAGTLQQSTSKLRHAASSACNRGVAFCSASLVRRCDGGSRSGISGSSSSSLGGRALVTTVPSRGAPAEDLGGMIRQGVWMKANKKNKRKRQQRQGAGSDSSGGAIQPQPQRVTKDAPISVRTQIKYAKMKKSMERSHKSAKKVVNNKYRRVKPLDYEDIVEPEDLSQIYMPDISPSLMVDGYNIMFYWSKCCMMADNGDLEGARQLLVEELDTVSAMRGWTVTVVFDAYKRKGGGRRKYVTPNKIEVVFTSNGESADMYVERLTEELKDAGCPNVMVATGDKLMQSLVVGAGAEVFSPDRIIEEIEICNREAVAYTDMYLRRKERSIEQSEMQDLLDTVRSVEERAKRRKGGWGGRGKGGRGSSRPTFNIEDDL